MAITDNLTVISEHPSSLALFPFIKCFINQHKQSTGTGTVSI